MKGSQSLLLWNHGEEEKIIIILFFAKQVILATIWGDKRWEGPTSGNSACLPVGDGAAPVSHSKEPYCLHSGGSN